MFLAQPGSLQRIFAVMGLVLLAYGFNEWRQLKPPTEAEIMQAMEFRYIAEIARLRQVHGPDYAEDAQWTAKRLAAIRSEVVGPYHYKRKRAASIMFAGGALLFIAGSTLFTTWLFRRLKPDQPSLKA